MARIYISSTFSDLQAHRQAVDKVLRKMGHEVISMENYPATDQRPLDKCLADVAECDIYVGIFAWRYGYIPPNQVKSITELEFREAIKKEKTRLIFILDEKAPWPRSLMDRDSENIEALRAELLRDYSVNFFSNADELAAAVVASVGKLKNPSTPGREDAPPKALTIRVYNFENHSRKAEAAKIGERFPGILLNQLLKLQLEAKPSEQEMLPMNVWQFRAAPPEDLVESFRNLAPYIIVSGYVEDSDKQGFYIASIRVSFIDKKLRDEVLLVEEVEFSENRKSMVTALGDMAYKIQKEAQERAHSFLE